MREQYHRQVEKLMSNYGKIDVLWWDGGETDWLNFGADWKDAGSFPKWVARPYGQHYKGGFSWRHEQMYPKIRRLQPQVLMNGRADMPEDFHSREGDGALGEFDNQHPWELCTTIAGAWGYQPNAQVKPLKHYIQLLANVAGRDGNLLLNVGPGPDGAMDAAQVERLREIGAWLGKHGDSIYDTRGGPFLPAGYGASTHRGNTVYLHVLNWPQDKLMLPAIPAKIVRATVLGGGKAGVEQTAQGIGLTVAPSARSDIDTVIALELDRPAATVGLVRVAGAVK
jgi:alpha-L-fucosidase